MNILSIDLNKIQLDVRFFDTETQEYSFLNASTTRGYLTTVLTPHNIDLVVMEAIGRGRDAGYPTPPHRSLRAELPDKAPTSLTPNPI